jgi:hypothetical protein
MHYLSSVYWVIIPLHVSGLGGMQLISSFHQDPPPVDWNIKHLPIVTYHTPSGTLSQLEKYNFSGERRNHWPGRCNRIKRTTTLLPSSGYFRKQTCDAIPLGRYISGIPPVGITQNERFVVLWQCSSRTAIYTLLPPDDGLLASPKHVELKVPRNRPEGPEERRGIALLFLDLCARRGWVVSAMPRPLYPQERPGIHCTGGWVGVRAGLDVCEKSPSPTRIRSPDRPARSQSLYRLSYPAPM